jgi:hypothetical protein
MKIIKLIFIIILIYISSHPIYCQEFYDLTKIKNSELTKRYLGKKISYALDTIGRNYLFYNYSYIGNLNQVSFIYPLNGSFFVKLSFYYTSSQSESEWRIFQDLDDLQRETIKYCDDFTIDKREYNIEYSGFERNIKRKQLNISNYYLYNRINMEPIDKQILNIKYYKLKNVYLFEKFITKSFKELLNVIGNNFIGYFFDEIYIYDNPYSGEISFIDLRYDYDEFTQISVEVIFEKKSKLDNINGKFDLSKLNENKIKDVKVFILPPTQRNNMLLMENK